MLRQMEGDEEEEDAGKRGWQNEVRKRWMLGKDRNGERDEKEVDAGKREERRTRRGRR